LNDPLTTHNIFQYKSDEQRGRICQLAERLLGTPYDWEAILQDATDTLHLANILTLFDPHDENEWEGGVVPGHVVCSSLYAWIYDQPEVDLPAPPREARFTFPSDWVQFWLYDLHLDQ
jgi:hypothetical protein